MASLASLLAGVPDPEAQGAVNSSNAMAPVVGPYLADVLSGRAAAQALPQSTYDPNRSFAQNALDPRGIENAMNMALGFSGGGLGIKAYHGSPYDFNAFDASKIGTGEGAQAYGHGLYFAEHPQTAGAYKNGVLNMPLITANNARMSDIAREMDALRKPGTYREFTDPRGYQLAEEYDHLMEQKTAPGKMYEVNINAEPHQFLDWDRPLSEQPQIQAAVQHAVGNLPMSALRQQRATYPSALGSDAYNNIARDTYGAARFPEASQALQQAGVPGIRYLDQGSRGAGQGTSNYVVFDPSIVDILKKYGLAGLLASGSAVLGQEDK